MPKAAATSNASLLEFDLLGGPSTSQPVNPQQPKPAQTNGGFGNLNGFGQPQGSLGSAGNLLGQQGGMGSQGFGLGGGLNMGMGMNGGLNSGFGGNPGMQAGLNSGFNSNLGGNQGFNQGLNTGFGSGMGMGAGMNMGMGGFTSAQPTQGGQAKKLVTFDSKSNTNDDFGGFQEAKSKDPVS